MKFVRLHFGRNWNRNRGAGYEKIQIDVNRFCGDVKQMLTPSELIYKCYCTTTTDAITHTVSCYLKDAFTNFM